MTRVGLAQHLLVMGADTGSDHMIDISSEHPECRLPNHRQATVIGVDDHRGKLEVMLDMSLTNPRLAMDCNLG